MNKIRSSILCLITVFFFFSCASTGEVVYNGENRYTDRAGGFSICPPPLWQTMEIPGLQNKVLVGPQDGDSIPNINFVFEKFEGELKQYTDGNIAVITQLFSNFRVIRRSDFVTKKNMKGEKLLYTFTQQDGRSVRMAQYFFPGREGTYVVISCGSSASLGSAYDELYDKTVGTFEWRR